MVGKGSQGKSPAAYLNNVNNKQAHRVYITYSVVALAAIAAGQIKVVP